MEGHKKTEVVITLVVVVFLIFCVFVGMMNKKILSDVQQLSQSPASSEVVKQEASPQQSSVPSAGIPGSMVGEAAKTSAASRPQAVVPSPTAQPKAVFDIPPQSDILVQ